MSTRKSLRIIHITPGSGDVFYCENCLRDRGIVKILHRLGHDAVSVPLYLPLQAGEPDSKTETPIFFGGINVYLQQKFSFFRRTPRWLDALFDWRKLLGLVSKQAGMTSGEELGETTLSMLQGEHGRQVKELERLVAFLIEHHRPDIVIISNALLMGLVRRIKEALGVPVVCLLQDEDTFIDSMPEPYRQRCWDVMTERGGEVDGFVAVSDYYAGIMAARLQIPEEKLKTVRVGVDLSAIAQAEAVPEPQVIGFLSRQCEEKGLHVLVDAFLRVKESPGLERTRLKLAGGKMASDRKFINRQMRKIRKAGFASDVEILNLAGNEEKKKFLQNLSVMCVPEVHGEACGLYVMEAAAAGVPSVQPENGVFPELMEELEGGHLFPPGDVDALARTLIEVLANPAELRKAGERCRRKMEELFSLEATVGRLAEVCASCCG